MNEMIEPSPECNCELCRTLRAGRAALGLIKEPPRIEAENDMTEVESIAYHKGASWMYLDCRDRLAAAIEQEAEDG
jgi:hypothetical protein